MSSRNELWLRGTKQNLGMKREDAKRCSKSPVFCDKYSFLLRTPVLRHGMPCLWLKDCHGRAAAVAMTRNSGRFYLENRRFSFFAAIFYAVWLRIVFQTFRSGNCSVFPQNLSDLSLRGGRIFCAVSLRIVFQTFIPKIVPFFRKTHQICHCEEGACAQRGNL